MWFIYLYVPTINKKKHYQLVKYVAFNNHAVLGFDDGVLEEIFDGNPVMRI